MAMTTGLRLEQAFRIAPPGAGGDPTRRITPEQWAQLRARVHMAVLEHFQNNGASAARRETVEAIADACVDEVAERAEITLSQRMRSQLLTEVADEVVGFGPIQQLLDDPTVTEVMVNGPRQVYVERKGQLELVDRIFLD